MTRAAGTAVQIACASVPRPGKARNEDLIATAGGIALLLDGASVPAGMASCCDRDAAWYVHQLAVELLTALAGDRGVDLRSALATAIAAADHTHAATCPGSLRDRDTMGPSSTVALTRMEGDRLDWLVLGDSTVLLQTDTGVTKHSDRRLASIGPEVRARIRQQLRDGGGYTNPAHRDALNALVATERILRNSEAGYWIAASDPDAAPHSLTGTCPIGSGMGTLRKFALLSDGAERAVSVFALYPSWDALLDTLTHEGPSACIAAVRAAESSDPEGQQYPRSRPNDDASALVCTLIDR